MTDTGRVDVLRGPARTANDQGRARRGQGGVGGGGRHAEAVVRPCGRRSGHPRRPLRHERLRNAERAPRRRPQGGHPGSSRRWRRASPRRCAPRSRPGPGRKWSRRPAPRGRKGQAHQQARAVTGTPAPGAGLVAGRRGLQPVVVEDGDRLPAEGLEQAFAATLLAVQPGNRVRLGAPLSQPLGAVCGKGTAKATSAHRRGHGQGVQPADPAAAG